MRSFTVDIAGAIDSNGNPPAAQGGLGPSPRGVLCREGLRRRAKHSPDPEYQRRSVEVWWNAEARPGKEGCGVSRRVQTGPLSLEGAPDVSWGAVAVAIAGIASLLYVHLCGECTTSAQPYSDAEGGDFRDSTHRSELRCKKSDGEEDDGIVCGMCGRDGYTAV